MLALSSLDLKVADWFQRPLKSTVENKNVIMIAVDDTAIEQIGTWPFSRDVYADSLITLRELGTEAVVFDLSFVDESQAKVDEEYVKETLPDYWKKETIWGGIHKSHLVSAALFQAKHVHDI